MFLLLTMVKTYYMHSNHVILWFTLPWDTEINTIEIKKMILMGVNSTASKVVSIEKNQCFNIRCVNAGKEIKFFQLKTQKRLF